MKIRIEDHITYCTVPAPFIEEMEPVFKAQGIPYELLYAADIPEEADHFAEYEGRKFRYGLCCIKSRMCKEDVQRLALSAWNPYKYGEIGSL